MKAFLLIMAVSFLAFTSFELVTTMRNFPQGSVKLWLFIGGMVYCWLVVGITNRITRR